MERARLSEIDKRYIWHPYTQHREYEKWDALFPIIERAEGIKLYDVEGRLFYDTISSWWCNLLGHNVERIVSAVCEQLKRLDHTLFAGISHPVAIELVDELRQVFPRHLCRYFFSDNGSTSVEVALKMSYQWWKRKGKRQKGKFIFLEYGYHGDTIGAMSVSGVSQFNSVFKDLFFDSMMIPSPSDDLDKTISVLRKVLEDEAESICGIILEPIIQCAGGMKIYSSCFLDTLGELKEEFGFHIIYDEIAVGMGRFGKWLLSLESKTEADFVCISKSITNGMFPLALTVTTDEIYEAFLGDYGDATFFHGHTYTANPIACRAALETVRILKEMDFGKKVRDVENWISGVGQRLKNGYGDIVDDVDWKGVMLRAKVIDADREKMFRIYSLGLENGIILRPLGDVIYLFLPIVIGRSEVMEVETALLNTMDRIREETKG